MSAAVPKMSGVVVPRKLSWTQEILASVLAFVFWLSIKSWRRTWRDKPNTTQSRAPVIFCIWHNHLLLAIASYDKHVRKKWNEKGLAVMVSASKDGAFLAGTLAKFGVECARGSTSRRGAQALLEATRWLHKGYSVGITPDGPRGPAHVIQDGIISLAQVSGRPIVPISNLAHWKLRMNSWDRFQIPLPFSRCDLYDGEPIYVPRDATEEQRQQIKQRLTEAMQAITFD